MRKYSLYIVSILIISKQLYIVLSIVTLQRTASILECNDQPEIRFHLENYDNSSRTMYDYMESFNKSSKDSQDE